LIPYFYNVFGLNIQSDIELPELNSSSPRIPDAIIRIGNIPEHLNEITSSGALYETSRADFLFKIKSVAKYRVTNGNLILIKPERGSLVEDVRLFLYGSIFGALLHQKGILPLHGSAVIYEEEAIAFIGHSASGKSTLAASLAIQGHQVIADDITAVAKKHDGNFEIYPGIPYLKLWKDVVSQLNFPNNLKKLRPGIEKYKFVLSQNLINTSFPFTKVIILDHHNNNDFKISRITGAKKLNLLKTHTYRFNYVEGLGQSKVQFQNLSNLSQKIDLYTISRPIAPLKINELWSLIEQEILHSNDSG
jgi:hypothetical protein